MLRVCVLGANGFIGKNLIRRNENWTGVTRIDLDLTDQNAVTNYFKCHTYDVVVHCAVIGGSRLKKDEGDVMWKNILMFENGVRVFKGKLSYVASGVSLRGKLSRNPCRLSLWIFDSRIVSIPHTHLLRILVGYATA